MAISFEAVTLKTIDTYISVGTTSYKEHYLHLWVNEDASSFLNENLTTSVVKKALADPNQKLFIVRVNETAVGILKITVDSSKYDFLSKNNVLLNKIYLLKNHSGKGIGKIALDFVAEWAMKNHKNQIWLYTMKKGNALNFYIKNGFKIIQEAQLELPNVKESEKEMWILSTQL